MKRILLLLLLFKVVMFAFYLLSKSKSSDGNDSKENDQNENKDHDIDFAQLSNHTVSVSNLEKCRTSFPFSRWRQNGIEYDMEDYTQENCEAIELIFDELIADLKILPTDATAEDKVLLFKYAVISTNAMSERVPGLIETGEREDLCELFDQISIAAGLEPKEFADGEGIASEWREW